MCIRDRTRATLILDDGTTAQTGTWDASDNSWKLASFEPVKAKQIRLVGIHTEASDGKDMHMSVAELRAKTVKPTTDISEEKNGIKVEVLGLKDVYKRQKVYNSSKSERRERQ